MSFRMSNKRKPNNSVNEAGASSEGLSPGSSPIGEQDGPGRHQITADRRTMKRKWSQEENRVVMQCYYRNEYGRNGYRKRMHVIWNEMGISEKRIEENMGYASESNPCSSRCIRNNTKEIKAAVE